MPPPKEVPAATNSGPISLPPGFSERSDEERRQRIWNLKGGQPNDLTAREKILWTVDSNRDPRAVHALTEILERDSSIAVQRAALSALRGS